MALPFQLRRELPQMEPAPELETGYSGLPEPALERRPTANYDQYESAFDDPTFGRVNRYANDVEHYAGMREDNRSAAQVRKEYEAEAKKQELTQRNAQSVHDASLFVTMWPVYIECQENTDKMMQWMRDHRIAFPRLADYESAATELIYAGQLRVDPIELEKFKRETLEQEAAQVRTARARAAMEDVDSLPTDELRRRAEHQLAVQNARLYTGPTQSERDSKGLSLDEIRARAADEEYVQSVQR